MRVSSYLSEPYVELSLAFATVSAASSGGAANPPSSRDSGQEVVVDGGAGRILGHD